MTASTVAWSPEARPDASGGGPLLNALGLDARSRPVIAAVGAGGKTTLVKALAHELAAAGARVAITTTTHMMREPHTITDVDEAVRLLGDAAAARPSPGLALQHEQSALDAADPPKPASDTTASALSSWFEPLLVGRETPTAKIAGLEDAALARLREASDALVIEADGSKRLPFKVPAGYEPVVPAWTDLLVVVVGLSALGRPLGEVCFRLGLALDLLGDPDAAARPLTPALAASLTRVGYLDNPALAGWASRRVVVLNQADTPDLAALGRALAHHLPGERVLLASNRRDAATLGDAR